MLDTNETEYLATCKLRTMLYQGKIPWKSEEYECFDYHITDSVLVEVKDRNPKHKKIIEEDGFLIDSQKIDNLLALVDKGKEVYIINVIDNDCWVYFLNEQRDFPRREIPRCFSYQSTRTKVSEVVLMPMEEARWRMTIERSRTNHFD